MLIQPTTIRMSWWQRARFLLRRNGLLIVIHNVEGRCALSYSISHGGLHIDIDYKHHTD